MANLFERSIMLTIGAAALARDIADSLAAEVAKFGEATTTEGRQVFEETMDKAKDEARSMRGRFDSKIQSGYRDMGIATSEQLDEIELKIAQLEHRISLLEDAVESAAKAEEETEAAREAEETTA